MVGGLLVALAALLAWWAAVGDGGPPATRYVVAARPIGPGERITAAHLGLATVDLGPELRSTAFTDPGSVIDLVAAGPIDPGELVQAGAVDPGDDRAEDRELTFPISATWAVGGQLRAGDRIDVFATYGEGASSTTRRVLTDAVVRRIDTTTADHLGDSGQQTITVGLAADIPVALVVNAVQSANLTVTRVSGPPRSAPPVAGTDRFDAATELDAPADSERGADGADDAARERGADGTDTTPVSPTGPPP